MAGFYQPAAKCGHTSVLVDEQLFVWAASRNLPEVHSSEEKQRATSYVDVFQSTLGTWEQCSTTGTPPLGVQGYASCHIDKHVFYLGGYCGHGTCYHNSVFGLHVDDLAWRELLAKSETSGPMKKGYCAMLPFDSRLLVMGGRGGEPPSDPSPSATYAKQDGLVYTNEHHLFDISTAEWAIPIVTGDVPPPIADFSFTKIWSDRAVLFGGHVLGDVSSELRLATVNWDNVHWQRVASSGPDHPMGRWCHATTSFTLAPPDSQPSLLLVVGGRPNSDSWIWDVMNVTWKRVIGLPDMITKRWGHSMSVIGASSERVWMMIIGGLIGEDSPQGIALFELKPSAEGHWQVTSVTNDEEIYSGYTERFSQTFPALMSARVRKLHEKLLPQKSKSREKELSQLLQESRQQLEFFQQQNVEKTKVIERLQQQTGETSSERAHLHGECVLSELERVNSLYHAQSIEKRLLEEKLKNSPTSLVKRSDSARDAAVQANYLSVYKEGSEMNILASTVIEVTGSSQQTFKWKGNGFRLTVPAGAVPEGKTVSVAIRAMMGKGFKLPERTQLVSALYWITTSEDFRKEVTMHMQHCGLIKNEAQCARFRIVVGKYDKSEDCHPLKNIKGGVFTPHTQEASYSISKYHFYAAACDAGPEDTSTYYWGQAYYLQMGWEKSWILDYIITTYVEAIMTCVQESYEGRGWTQHHEQMLEYEDCPGEDSEPTISVVITESNGEQQKNWEVAMITSYDFKQSCVDALSDRAHFPFIRIGAQWKGSSTTSHYSFIRKIVLTGAIGPHNYFRMFLPAWIRPETSFYLPVSAGAVQPMDLTNVSTTKAESVLPKKRLGDKDDFVGPSKKSREDSSSTSVPQEGGDLDEDDLQTVLTEIESICGVRNLGLALGLQVSKMEKIERDYESIECQKTQVIFSWLQRMDIVPEKKSSPPTWGELAKAVASEDGSVSEHIKHRYCA